MVDFGDVHNCDRRGDVFMNGNGMAWLLALGSCFSVDFGFVFMVGRLEPTDRCMISGRTLKREHYHFSNNIPSYAKFPGLSIELRAPYFQIFYTKKSSGHFLPCSSSAAPVSPCASNILCKYTIASRVEACSFWLDSGAILPQVCRISSP